jgi:hypothetical protein
MPALFPAERSPVQINIERKNALARALTPEYAGINPDDYEDITYGMVDQIQPNALAGYLIGIAPPNRDDDSEPSVLSYYDSRQRREVYIAVTAQEATLMPRSVGAIRRGARLATANTVVTAFPTDADRGREKRSGKHVHEDKLDILKKFRDNVYAPQGLLLDKFIEASQGHQRGLARLGDEGKMRSAIATLRTQIFGDIVRAYGRQRNLSESTTNQVDRTITTAIYLDRVGNRHITNFSNLVRFAKTYNLQKMEVVNQRIEAIERALG